MKPPPFAYHAPTSLEAACQLLGTLENAKILAGGQSLMAMLNLRFLFPDDIIDINRLPGLDRIVVENGILTIGALARQRAVETHRLVAQVAPIFAEALAVVGHRQTRNRGTLGGSLCHLDPAAELPLIALLHDATITAAAAGARARTIPVAAFIAGFMSPAIGPDEIVTEIAFPLWPQAHGHAFVERARRHGDFAIASVACLLTLDPADRVDRIALGVGGLGSVPARLSEAELILAGKPLTDEFVTQAAAAVAGLEAITDFHGRAEYRRSIARALVRTAIDTAGSRVGRSERAA